MLAVAEADPFDFSTQVDASALVGQVSGLVEWGDGSTSPATISAIDTNGPLTAVIRYDYDTRGFFTSERRVLLQAAVDAMVERLTDSLSAINPGGSNTWTATLANPADRTKQISLPNLNVKANELIIYAGSQPLPGSQLAEGSFGGFSASGTQSFLDSVSTRGQAGAAGNNPTDFGPWGGSITFDSEITDWYFDKDIDGIQPNEVDFVSVAMHEIGHLLGFGTSQAWNRLVSGGGFTGEKSRAAYDGSGDVPVSGGHWLSSVTDDGQATLLDPSLTRGTRTYPTALDWAGLDDLGWTLADRLVTVSGSHVYADNAAYDVNVLVNGNRLGERSKELVATVTNVAPTLQVSENLTVTVGQPISITDIGQISDPGFRNTTAGSDETFIYSIDWGDASTDDSGDATIDQIGNATRPTLASFNASHTYTSTGIKTVGVTVTDDDGGTATQSFQIIVTGPSALLLTLDRSSIDEDAGNTAAQMTVSRGTANASTALTVTLSSSDTSEAQLPATVTIPAGQASVDVAVSAIDDNLLDGGQVVLFTATAAGFISANAGLTVNDAESIIATMSAAEVLENASSGSVSLTVARSNTDSLSSLTVSLTGDAADSLGLGSTITIPAGQQQVVIPIELQDDSLQQGPRNYQLTFTAAGYAAGSASLKVNDDEPAFYQNPENRLDVNGDTFVTPIDALRILNELNLNGGPRQLDPASEPLGENFYDTSGDYFLTPLDALIVINSLNRSPTAVPEGESTHDSIWAVDVDWLLDLERRSR